MEIVGVPIQIWSEQNIRKIAENWGDVVSVDRETASLESFASAKVVIDTLSVNPIEDEAIIQVGDLGFRVSVFEARSEFTIIHIGSLEEETSAPSMKSKHACKVDDLDSNGVMAIKANLDHENRQKDHDHDDEVGHREDEQPGAVGRISNLNSNHINDVGQHRDLPTGSINSVVDVDKSSKLGDARLEDDRSEGVGRDSLLLENEAEEVKGQIEGTRGSYDALSESSSTKTKTAQLSGNDYSEEIEKIYRHKQASQ